MRQISRRMEMIHPTIGWRRDEHGTHKHAHGSWILWSVSRFRLKTMHSLFCTTSWLPYITLCYIDSRFFLPLKQSRTALLGCRLASSRLFEAARWQLITWAHLEWSSRKLVSYSFACHVCSCKVKYFWKVANVWVRIRGEDNVFPCLSQHCHSMSPTSYQLATRRMKQANCLPSWANWIKVFLFI